MNNQANISDEDNQNPAPGNDTPASDEAATGDSVEGAQAPADAGLPADEKSSDESGDSAAA